MRPTRPAASGNNRLERRACASSKFNFIVDTGGELVFGNAGPDTREDLCKDVADEHSGFAESVQFAGTLDRAKTFDSGGIVGPAHPLAQASGDDVALGYGDVAKSSSNGDAAAPFGKMITQRAKQPRLGDHGAGNVDFLAGLKGVAAVRKEGGAAVFDQQDAGATGKAAEIEDISRQRNEKRFRLDGF
jgi:hypothetical protein